MSLNAAITKPAGTAYQVYEETPKGWVLVEQSGVSGTIEPLQTQKAAFVNKYEPGTATAQFFGTKTLDGRAAAGGAFKFVLKEGDEVIQADVPTLDGGFIQFDPIVYREAGTHTYTIEEMDPQDEALDWDTHSETVTVEVTADEDGNLTAAVTTDEDGIVFANKTRPGNLRITKNTDIQTEANKNDEFTFKITLNNANGMPLGSEDTVYWYIESPQPEDAEDNEASPIAGPASDADLQTAPIRHSTQLPPDPPETPLVSTMRTAAGDDAAIAGPYADSTEDGTSVKVADDATLETSITAGDAGAEILLDYYSDQTLIIRPADGEHGRISAAALRAALEDNGFKKSAKQVLVLDTIDLYGEVSYLFADASSFVDLDLRGFNTAQLTDMTWMFVRDVNLEHLDISTWDTSNVTSIYCAFAGLPKIKTLDLHTMDTGKVTKAGELFENDSQLKELNLSGWIIRPNVDTRQFFENCDALGYVVFGPQTRVYYTSYKSNTLPGGLWKCLEEPDRVLTGEQIKELYKDETFTEDRTWARLFDVHFDPNGAGGDSVTETYAYSESMLLQPAEELGMYDDRTFAGWSESENGADVEYLAGSKYTVTGEATLYAKWMDPTAFMIRYDANGGFSSTQASIVDGPDTLISLPTPEHPKDYPFLGWNTEPDGTGETFTGTISGADLDAEAGSTVILYAMWPGQTHGEYKVEHYKENISNDEYSLAETETAYALYNTTVSPAEKQYEGFTVKAHDAEYTITKGDTLEIPYYYDRNSYQIRYDGNGADSGQMNTPQTLKYDQQAALLKNTYQKKGSLFTGWNTEAGGGGTTYFDRQKVKNLTAEDGGTVTLYAQWMSNEDNRLEPTNGEIIVKCKAGESIVIPDLPAGTTYTIEEISTPAGWSQSGEIDGGSGTIEANVTKDAAVDNAYTAQGQAQINAHKILNGGDIDDCTFTFELLDADGSVVDTKTQGLVDTYEQIDSEDGESLVDNPYYQTALVQFDPFAEQLQFTQDDIGKDYTYTIREVKNSEEDGIEYDAHEYHATVHIEDAGHGQLSAAVTYDFDADSDTLEPIFINNMKPASLSVTKSVENATDDVKDTAFTFTVDLFDAEGNPLEGDFTVTKRTAAGEESQAGTVKAGGTIELSGGETAVIESIPHDATYKVTEQAVKNWEQTAAENPEGGFTAGETTAVSFTNTYTEPEPEEYDAVGSVQLTAKKIMEGGTIRLEDGFQFELTDAQGEVIDTKGPDRVSREADPDNGVAAEDVTESTITFDPIEYDLSMLDYPDDVEDQISAAFQTAFEAYQKEYNEAKAAYEEAYGQEHPDEAIPKYKDFAKYLRDEHGTTLRLIMEQVEKEIKDSPDNRRQATFTYYVREVEGADQTIEYDTARYYYVVHVKDEGDGTLSTDVTCFKPGTTQKTDEEGNPVVDEYGEPVYEDTPLEEIAFVNKKSAELKVRKVDSRTGETLEGVRFTVEKTDAEAGDDAADGRLYLQSDGTLAETPYEFVTGKTGTFSVSDVPAGRYTLTETEALPGYIAAAPVTFEVKEGQVLEDGDPVSVITVHNSKDYGQLVIEKTLSKFKSSEPVTCVFSVVADLNGEIVYDQYVSMTFSDAGTQKVVIKDIPKEAVVTVTEVYAGAGYTAEGEQVIVLRDEDNKASFTNSYDDQSLSGYGATNIYERSEGGWSWKQLAEEAVIDAGGDSPGDTEKN